MAFDYKKEYKEFYLPSKKPEIIEIPPMNFLAVRGSGDPNAEEGEYKRAINLLYGIAYTLKMSYKTSYKIQGFFEYVVPPLEGFWWLEGIKGMDYTQKDRFQWISVIRLPEFIGKEDFEWALKKKEDFSKVEFLQYDEGLCVQCMHVGAFDDEPATVEVMDEFIKAEGYLNDITDTRYHHEIYLSDFRKCAPEKRKTVIRHPIKKNR